LKTISDGNFQANTKQADTKDDTKSIAYLVTPGVFERPHKYNPEQRVNLCRPYPWEWKLKDGIFVSMSTDKAVPISCRIRGNMFACHAYTCKYRRLELKVTSRISPLPTFKLACKR
ncbi:MAG: type III-B CRISPR module-associated Cmr3 family protein, partial [Dolichospermum sp.]